MTLNIELLVKPQACEMAPDFQENELASAEIGELVDSIATILGSTGRTVTSVESCTGGGIAYSLTSIPGSSQWFERSFVTYSNNAKQEMVGVTESLLEKFGAVSVEVAEAMALGGRAAAKADYAVSVSGVAGPGGGTESKPVGTVCFAWALPNGRVVSLEQLFDGDRCAIRTQSIEFALMRLLKHIN